MSPAPTAKQAVDRYSGQAKKQPHRLSLSDILTMTLTRSGHVGESVTLTRNARGETQVEVTARTADGETLEQAGARARAEYARNIAAHPTKSGYVENTGGK